MNLYEHFKIYGSEIEEPLSLAGSTVFNTSIEIIGANQSGGSQLWHSIPCFAIPEAQLQNLTHSAYDLNGLNSEELEQVKLFLELNPEYGNLELRSSEYKPNYFVIPNFSFISHLSEKSTNEIIESFNTSPDKKLKKFANCLDNFKFHLSKIGKTLKSGAIRILAIGLISLFAMPNKEVPANDSRDVEKTTLVKIKPGYPGTGYTYSIA